MENNLHHEIRHIRILAYALWANQWTTSIRKMDQQDPTVIYDICCIVYLDDVPIYSDSLEQHQKDVAAIIRVIRKQGMTLKPSKCEFHQRETEYLGCSINNEGVKGDPIKTAAIWHWKPPGNKKGIQEFIGF